MYNLKFPRSSQFARGRPPSACLFFRQNHDHSHRSISYDCPEYLTSSSAAYPSLAASSNTLHSRVRTQFLCIRRSRTRYVSRSILRRGQPEGTVQQRQRCSDLGVRLPNVARRQVPRRQTKGDSDYQDAYLQNQLPRSPRRVYAGRLGREQWKHSNCHGFSQQIENRVENERRNQGELCRYCCMNLIRARLTVMPWFTLDT